MTVTATSPPAMRTSTVWPSGQRDPTRELKMAAGQDRRERVGGEERRNRRTEKKKTSKRKAPPWTDNNAGGAFCSTFEFSHLLGDVGLVGVGKRDDG